MSNSITNDATDAGMEPHRRGADRAARERHGLRKISADAG